MLRTISSVYEYNPSRSPFHYTIKYNGVVYIPEIPSAAKCEYKEEQYIFWSVEEATEFLDEVDQLMNALLWSDPMCRN